MAGYGRIDLGEGVASAQIAYVDDVGTRHPSSGYETYTGSTGNLYVDHIYVYSITLENGYGYPWKASYTGYYNPSVGNDPSSGNNSVVDINIYPTYPMSGNPAIVTISASYGGSSGGGGEDYDYVTMTIRIDNAIKYLQLYYIQPDGTGEYAYAYDGDTFDVRPGSTQQVTSIYLDGDSDYGNPLYCEGDSVFQVTNANGSLVDPYLSVGTRNKTFLFYGTEKVKMGIECGKGVSAVTVTYYDKNGTTTTRTFTNSTPAVEVMPGSTQTILSITLASGYSHPVWCSGDSDFQVTSSSGGFVDQYLSMGSKSKTFEFYVKTSSGDGGVKICIGTDSDGNSVWATATPYIWTGSAWVQATPYIYTESGWTQTS